MTRQELQTAVTDLLEWRAQVEVRLAAAEKWHTPALNPATDVDAYDGRWFSGSGEGLDFLLPTFAEAAWDLTVRWLWEEYGLGSSGEAVHYYEDGEEKYSCGCYAYDENRWRNEVYLCTAASHGDEVGLAILVEWLTDFHWYKSLTMKGRKVYGLFITLDDVPAEFRQAVWREGVHLAVINEQGRSVRMDLPADFVAKDFGAWGKQPKKTKQSTRATRK